MYSLKCAVALIAAVAAVGANELRAQALAPDRLSISLGATETFQGDPVQPKFALYPEIELDFDLAKSEGTGLSLGGAFYVAGWTDGVRSVFRVR